MDLGGSVDPEVRASLVELWAVRNVLVHRRGRTDARFKESCPWLAASPRDEICVSMKMFTRYMAASMAYASEVMKRVYLAYGEPTGALDRFLADLVPLARRPRKRA